AWKQHRHGLRRQQPSWDHVEQSVRGELAHERAERHPLALLARLLEQLLAELLLRLAALVLAGRLEVEQLGVVDPGQRALDLEVAAIVLELAQPPGESVDLAI